MFTFQVVDDDNLNVELIATVVNRIDNALFCAAPDAQQIKGIVMDMNEDRGPGLDGFALFFQPCQHIIGKEISKAVIKFFHSFILLHSFACSNLVLVPKVHSPPSLKICVL